MDDDYQPIPPIRKFTMVMIHPDDLAHLKAERDAYKRAKAENDERFQLEIGELKQERDRLREALVRISTWYANAPNPDTTISNLQEIAREALNSTRQGGEKGGG